MDTDVQEKKGLMLFDTFFRIERGFKVCCGGNSG